MPRTDPVIRLVGGPRPLDGATYEPALSPHDRADLDGDRFVRAFRGTTVASLAALQERCTDRATAEELAARWSCAVFAYRRDRRLRTRYFRYQATLELVAARDEHGRWSLAIGDRPSQTTSSVYEPVGRQTGRSAWVELEHAVDEAATRFVSVASLLPEGPLAERAESTRRAVGSCVIDATRLSGVGTAIAPDWLPGTTDPDDRLHRLAMGVAALVGTIDQATAHLVDLHLEIGDAGDPVEPLAHLGAAWTELGIGIGSAQAVRSR